MQYEGFVVYRSFYEAIEKIPEEEQLIAYKIMMDYALNDALPEDVRKKRGKKEKDRKS